MLWFEGYVIVLVNLSSLISQFLYVIMKGIAELAGDESSKDRSRTFVFSDEGHTLGNALRSIISYYPEVLFCGYTVPHPAETKMHFRIQTDGPKAVDILQRGLQDLDKLCEHTAQLFQEAMDEYSMRSRMLD